MPKNFFSKRIMIWLLAGIFGMGLMTIGAHTVMAAQGATDGLTAVGNTIGLSAQDPREIAARIINAALGLVGIILLVIIIYAGYLWMTAGGNGEQVEKAQKYIRNAIIGVVIILTAWAITTFVINALLNATGSGTGGNTSGGGGSGGGGFGGGSADVFKIVSATPQGDQKIANIVVRVLFNKDIDSVELAKLQIQPAVNGAWSLEPGNAKRAVFTPTDPCPGAPQKTCFALDTAYSVTVPVDFKAVSKEQIKCGGFYPACTFNFKSGNIVDIKGPDVEILMPMAGQSVPVNSAVQVTGRAKDDNGVSGMEWREEGVTAPFNADGPSGTPTPNEFTADGYWDTFGKTPKQSYTLVVKAWDTDTNDSEAQVRVTVLAEHCFNNTQDGDETGKDCGGADCLLCSGGGSACTNNNQCASNNCVNGVCVDKPVIMNVAPLSGKAGTFVTIVGKNFGTSGQVWFMGPPEIEAQAPQSCLAIGTQTWTDGAVVVAVPDNAGAGPIRIQNSDSGLGDTTDDEIGPKFSFTPSSEEFPGLCGMAPETDLPGKNVDASGENFGASAGSVLFGNLSLTQNLNWGAQAVKFVVPVTAPGQYSVGIKTTDNKISNPAIFTVKSASTQAGPPQIIGVDPPLGPRGTYVTITGNDFGNLPGTVTFQDLATGKNYLGDSAFPAECSTNWWKNTQVIVKVPGVDANVAKPAQFKIYLTRKDLTESSKVDFNYTDGEAAPGICGIKPSAGPEGTVVEINGERFGSLNAASKLIFANGKMANIIGGGWQGNSIKASVPAGAITGAVYAHVNGKDSNQVQFKVASCLDDADICAAGEQCCGNGACSATACAEITPDAEYSWQISTGVIPRGPRVVENCDVNGGSLPSPTPWRGHQGGDEVCVAPAPVLGILFDMEIQWPMPSGSGTAIKLQLCKAQGSDPCAERENVALAATEHQVISTPSSKQSYLIARLPAGYALKADSEFLVSLSKDIHSADLVYGDIMDEDGNCPEAESGYCYRFHTRKDTGNCTVGAVYIAPDKALVQGGDVQPFQAMPAAQGGVCNLMECTGLEFDWNTDPGHKAWIYNDPNNPVPATACKQTVQAGMLEAGSNDPVKISAEERVSKINGLASLYIAFIKPRVVDKYPECNEACVNSLPWAQFNTSLWSKNQPAGSENSVEAPANNRNCPPGYSEPCYYRNVQLYACENENCLVEKQTAAAEIPIKVKVEPVSYLPQFNKPELEYSFVSVTPQRDLKAATYYVIRFQGGKPGAITSKYGVLMEQNVEWKFRTKIDAALCKPERVDIQPVSKIENEIGAREMFKAAVFGRAGECHAMGQFLKINTAFDWKIADLQVAKYLVPGGIDTGGSLPIGCTGDCLAAGARGVFGATAQCGNSLIETTDNKYCVAGKTLAGENCVLLPNSSGAGEQCDGGGLCDPSTCLWLPTSVCQNPNGQANCCGNTITEHVVGEMCDPGYRCFGVSADKPALLGALCNTQAVIDACNNNGGACAVAQYNGCSAGCKNLGASSVVGTTCGEGTIGLGEDCDMGNLNGGSGCSRDCLHVGSSASLGSVCGNGNLEPGETCEGAAAGLALPAWCDSAKCVKSGKAPCNNPLDDNCCGNGGKSGGIPETGEECDDGNSVDGDGCSGICLMEGSSWSYKNPSFCGNGIVEVGEICEVGAASNNAEQAVGGGKLAWPYVLYKVTGAGDGLMDQFQVAEIVGQGTPDGNGLMQTQVSTDYQDIEGKATYGVQCGKTDETQCAKGQGLDKNGCCAPRPVLDVRVPAPGSVEVCRNVLIKAKFAEDMDVNSVTGNFIIAMDMGAVNDCPAGTVKLSEAQGTGGWWGWIVAQWQKLATWLTGEPAEAVYCAQTVSGTLAAVGDSKKDFAFKLEKALDPNVHYIVRFVGDKDAGTAGDNHIREGILTLGGVAAIADIGVDPGNNNWQFSWSFTTGADICRINNIQVTDYNIEHPNFFKRSLETHPFAAEAQSIKNGAPQSIVSTVEYGWQWQPWVVNDADLASHDDQPDTSLPIHSSFIVARNKNGVALVFAGVKITSDTMDPDNSTTGQYITGAAPITVFICEQPWPAVSFDGGYTPFADLPESGLFHDGQGNYLPGYSQNSPYYYFQTMYCRDHENGFMPALNPSLIPLSLTDKDMGILRQYLLTYNEAAYKRDGIGIRVFENPFHLTPLEWYHAQGFVGSPQEIKIDGYNAIRDGGTVYAAFANTKEKDANIYQNIFVISHNLDASAITKEIFEKLVENLAFNINFEKDNSNVCVDGNGLPYANPETKQPAVCVSDPQCHVFGPQYSCASFKFKVQHDMQRLMDLKLMTGWLEDFKNRNNQYPNLADGTFLVSQTNSKWPSWQDALGKTLGQTMPMDPVNTFVSCGFCQAPDSTEITDKACNTDKDCPEAYSCVAKNGYDPETCWNADERKFLCPYMDEDGKTPPEATQVYDPYDDTIPDAPSFFYRYRALDGGRRFELGAQFELPPSTFSRDADDRAIATQNWWYPNYPVEYKYCKTGNPISEGRVCTSNDDCKPCINPKATTCTQDAPANSCQPAGFRFIYKNICGGSISGESGICGDGVIGGACLNNGKSCKSDTDCPGSSCTSIEKCELNQTSIVGCDTDGDGTLDGERLDVCQDCNKFVQDPVLSVCRPKVQCGNGRIDDGEVCDEGVINGTYGHCAKDCQGYGSYCGDSNLQPGESCDAGADNGRWCADVNNCYNANIKLVNSCGYGCQGKAPFCGDGHVDMPDEACDGETLVTPSALCFFGPKKYEPCTSNADCGGNYCPIGYTPGVQMIKICDSHGQGDNKPFCTDSDECDVGTCDTVSQDMSRFVTCAGTTINRCATAAKACLTATQVNQLKNGTFPASYNFQSCGTDAGCGAGTSCVPLSLRIKCTNNAQCSTDTDSGECKAYPTVHVRECGVAGTVNQCKYGQWSQCQLSGICGDGGLDAGEECDLGAANLYSGECLPTCKLPKCGDGYTRLKTEECDNGSNNGKSVCPAQYSSTCNDCSTQCKFMAKAGGYCGNGIKENNEQCDGNIIEEPKVAGDFPNNTISNDSFVGTLDAVGIAAKSYVGATCGTEPCHVMKEGDIQTALTCQQLGYDFATNDLFNKAIHITDQAKADAYRLPFEGKIASGGNVISGTRTLYGTHKLVADNAQNMLLNRLMYVCGLMNAEETTFTSYQYIPNQCSGQNECWSTYFKPQNEWPSQNSFWQCAYTQGLAHGFELLGESNSKPLCTASCQPGGCGRCSEEAGDGKIFGYVVDRLWLQAAPGARVTLQYRGINVAQDMTDVNGRFDFSNMNLRSECGKYRLVIDKFDDNICTDISSARNAVVDDEGKQGCLQDITVDLNLPKIDEGANGGYWSFTTDEFSAESFPYQNSLGMIYIYPRPAKGEGYVSYGAPTLFNAQSWQQVKDCQKNGDTNCLISNINKFFLPWQANWGPHVIWPVEQARFTPLVPSGLGGFSAGQVGIWGNLCSYKDRGTSAVGDPSYQKYACAVDYNQKNPGNLNLGAAPYTAVICPNLAWDRANSADNGCPLSGTDACVEKCNSGTGAEWRLFKEWFGFSPTLAACQNYCGVNKGCDENPIGRYGNVYRCEYMINSAQASTLFRYQDPDPNHNGASLINDPIKIYFAGPDYEPILGKSYYTSVLNDSEVSQWIDGNKPSMNSFPGWVQPLWSSLPQQVASWREVWGRTNTKVYVATDKGFYNAKASDQKTSVDEFGKPFWNIASIGTNGQVAIVNKWLSAYDLDLPGGKMPYDDAYTATVESAKRPVGLACWNNFGASCTFTDTPWIENCKMESGDANNSNLNDILSVFIPVQGQTDSVKNNICGTIWSHVDNNSTPVRYNNYNSNDVNFNVPGKNEYIRNFNRTNW